MSKMIKDIKRSDLPGHYHTWGGESYPIEPNIYIATGLGYHDLSTAWGHVLDYCMDRKRYWDLLTVAQAISQYRTDTHVRFELAPIALIHACASKDDIKGCLMGFIMEKGWLKSPVDIEILERSEAAMYKQVKSLVRYTVADHA